MCDIMDVTPCPTHSAIDFTHVGEDETDYFSVVLTIFTDHFE